MKHIILSLFVGGLGAAIFGVPSTAFAQNYSYPYGYPNNQAGYSQYSNQYANNQASNYNQYANTPYSMDQYYANRLPVYTSQPVTAATVGTGYVYDVRAFDPDSNKITYGLSQAPAGMVINQVTHLVNWTPSAVGSFPVTVVITDYANQPVYQSFTVHVSAAAARPVATTQATGGTASTQTTSGSKSTFGLFGNSKAKPLAIENITVTTGPRNINSFVANANCSVAISWTTTVPSVGRVVYGTVSQPNVNALNYDQVAIAGSALSTSHSVSLPSCVDEQVYYFRVVVANNTEQIASDEKVIMPLAVEVAPGTTGIVSEIGSASVMASIGRFFLNPIVIVILLGLLIFYIIFKARSGAGHGDHGGGNSHDQGEEPMIAIPHH